MPGKRLDDPVHALAEALRELKERTPQSYDTLASQLNVSRSALHRYCTGRAVPPDFQVVELLARHANAQGREISDLYRKWDLARESRPAAESPTAQGPESPAVDDEAAQPHDQASLADTPTDAAPTAPVVIAEDVGPRTATPAPVMELWRRGPWISAGLAVAVLLTAVITWNIRGMVDAREQQAAPAPATTSVTERPGSGRKLFGPECGDAPTMGQHDDCVVEVQQLLADHGAKIGVDGQFGPETLRRVTAFQVLAGLDADGLVGPRTKEALYTSDVTMTTWTPKQVTERIRQVFAETPELAVRIADCQSFLDPLHILPNTDGSRNWGVFQISDARLRDLRGTPRDALDPEWNITAAHRLWARNKTFDDWPNCLAAAREATPQPHTATP
ncbi:MULTISPECIES: helix-turn-helix domain-containing protein [unclassified Streptomyces]|uniref:helix-turn-helix domain-containing protein n=1 Tax=unclassified Streptomyces TaxID=2593676 RepID=UPI00370342D0